MGANDDIKTLPLCLCVQQLLWWSQCTKPPYIRVMGTPFYTDSELDWWFALANWTSGTVTQVEAW